MLSRSRDRLIVVSHGLAVIVVFLASGQGEFLARLRWMFTALPPWALHPEYMVHSPAAAMRDFLEAICSVRSGAR
jgi:hypothetical protein